MNTNAKDLAKLCSISLITTIGVVGIVLPSKAVPAGVPNRNCVELSNPRPGDVCYVLHSGLGGKAVANGSPQNGMYEFQPQAGYYVVLSTVYNEIARTGNANYEKKVLSIGSVSNTVNQYSSTTTNIARTTAELRGQITGVYGPAAATAEASIRRLEEQVNQYSQLSRNATSASQNAPLTQYIWHASPRSCGTFNWDSCGSEINFEVYEVRQYLGDPVAEYNAQIAPALNQARADVAAAVTAAQQQVQPVPPVQPVPGLTPAEAAGRAIGDLLRVIFGQ